jgi:hypothetical protein
MTLDADTTRCTIGFTGEAVPNGAAVVLALDNPGMAVALADVADELTTNLIQVMDNFVTTLTLSSVLVKQGPDETGPSGVFSYSLTGNYGAGACPPNTSVLISKVTNQGGRSGRGRMYWPGIREDQIDNGGMLNSGLLAGVQAGFDGFLADMATSGLQLVLEHGPDSPFGIPGVVSALPVSSKVATQRRRLRR